ncbi:hypothetical protein B0T24DRAFT_633570 [Lasiosphaeria ovina]|uniref:Uncharacterized protein n=1 Tax=Lasiosphaeria ovina TaxID=92902 RepID=A0AAE0N292_9PEZI|nr:hypothetical protein B0T24DRAFT_633570 [Lasiosphaeria ovina]
MLGFKLDRVSERSKNAATRSLVYPGAIMLLGLLLPPAGQADFWYRYVRGAVWAVFGLCTACSCFAWLESSTRHLAPEAGVCCAGGAENELIPQSELGPLASSLSFWGWSIFQFITSYLFG